MYAGACTYSREAEMVALPLGLLQRSPRCTTQAHPYLYPQVSPVGMGGMWPANQRLQSTLPSAALLRIMARNTEYGIREHSCHALEAIFGHLSGRHFVFPLSVWVNSPSLLAEFHHDVGHGLNTTILLTPFRPRHVPVGTKSHQPGYGRRCIS